MVIEDMRFPILHYLEKILCTIKFIERCETIWDLGHQHLLTLVQNIRYLSLFLRKKISMVFVLQIQLCWQII